jgi:hypothetical protein
MSHDFEADLERATDPEEIKRLKTIIADQNAKAIGMPRMVAILKSLGISMLVDACGCCSGPYVEFTYNGESIVETDYANFNTETAPETWNTGTCG